MNQRKTLQSSEEIDDNSDRNFREPSSLRLIMLMIGVIGGLLLLITIMILTQTVTIMSH